MDEIDPACPVCGDHAATYCDMECYRNHGCMDGGKRREIRPLGDIPA